MMEIKYRAFLKLEKIIVAVDELRFFPVDYSQDELELYNVHFTKPHSLTRDMRKLEDVELMQYIGLKDRNGVEIYEGDVISLQWNNSDSPSAFSVVWSEPYGRFRFKLGGNGPCLDIHKECKARACIEPVNWEANYHSKCKVIGNIYENPELLEVD